MERIKLTDNAKKILLALNNDESIRIADTDKKDLILLEQEGLVTPNWTDDGPYPDITDYGIAYVHINPTLKNPSIWEDKKYWITTSISILALFASVASVLIAFLGNCKC